MIGTRKEDPDLHENGLTGSLADYGVTYKYVSYSDTSVANHEARYAVKRQEPSSLIHDLILQTTSLITHHSSSLTIYSLFFIAQQASGAA